MFSSITCSMESCMIKSDETKINTYTMLFSCFENLLHHNNINFLIFRHFALEVQPSSKKKEKYFWK